ncbi:MAG: hypothetical protein L3J15_01990, partial [Devosiaceae bacterium]|nr:hypothetical protein [Devosiaceae bacterium]
EFKKSRFDDPRSSFSKDSLTGSLLSEFLSGAISAAIYWQQFQGSQSWRSGTSDWGSGFGLPRTRKSSRGSSSPWGSTSRSGGEFSRPSRSRRGSSRPSRGSRSGSSGSRKSGGFKTGGGF